MAGGGASGDFKHVRISEAPGDVIVVELHRPEHRNAVNPELHHELAGVFRHVQDISEQAGAIVITGARGASRSAETLARSGTRSRATGGWRPK